MGIRYGQESAYVQERRKWEHEPTMIEPQWVSPQVIDGVKRDGYMDGTYITPIPREQGGKAGRIFEPYPKMLYKAVRADGGPTVDVLGGSGTFIVHSEQEDKRMQNRGWCESQEAAIAAIHAENKEWATLAAERNHDVRRMSERARAEVAAIEDANSNHVPVIPTTPIKKRGRPVKVSPAQE